MTRWSSTFIGLDFGHVLDRRNFLVIVVTYSVWWLRKRHLDIRNKKRRDLEFIIYAAGDTYQIIRSTYIYIYIYELWCVRVDFRERKELGRCVICPVALVIELKCPFELLDNNKRRDPADDKHFEYSAWHTSGEPSRRLFKRMLYKMETDITNKRVEQDNRRWKKDCALSNRQLSKLPFFNTVHQLQLVCRFSFENALLHPVKVDDR
jgi:hypothetical protein